MLKMCGQESSEMQDSSMTVTWKMPDAPENEISIEQSKCQERFTVKKKSGIS